MSMKLDKLIDERSPRDLAPHPIPASEMCERYERLYSGAINDVLREHNLLNQALPHDILPLREEMVVAGDVFTVKGAPTMEVNDDMRVRGEMLAAIPAYSVVVWDTTRDERSAQWGEVMTMTAKRSGCRGAIVDGGVRDTRQVLRQEFPVWARYRTSSAMMGRFRVTGWGVPVDIGGVHIFPGDLVFADIDGAVVVPRALAFEVLVRSEEIAGNEERIKKWVDDGVPVGEVLDRGGYF